MVLCSVVVLLCLTPADPPEHTGVGSAPVLHEETCFSPCDRTKRAEQLFKFNDRLGTLVLRVFIVSDVHGAAEQSIRSK